MFGSMEAYPSFWIAGILLTCAGWGRLLQYMAQRRHQRSFIGRVQMATQAVDRLTIVLGKPDVTDPADYRADR